MDADVVASGSRQGSLARAADALVEALARRIRCGDLAPGARLPPERDLMTAFGVSRTVVREAVATLAGHGLIATRPGYRPVVRRPDYAAALEAMGGLVAHLVTDRAGARTLYETRIFLEAALARHAALHASAEDLETLAAALAANRAAIGDTPRFHESDAAFHAVFYRIPGNPIYPALHRAYVEWLSGHWAAMRHSAEADALNVDAHAAILHAVADRRPDEAEAAARAHLRTAWSLLEIGD